MNSVIFKFSSHTKKNVNALDNRHQLSDDLCTALLLKVYFKKTLLRRNVEVDK